MKKQPAKLRVISTTLPAYLKIDTENINSLHGRIQIDESANMWKTPSGNILTLNEDDGRVSFQLEAEPSSSGTYVQYSILPPIQGRGGRLPFSFTINRQTGEISGHTTQNILVEDPVEFFEEERPVWDTASGVIVRANERETISTSLRASSMDGSGISYFINSGNIPFGVSLNRSTGEISGNVGDVYFENEENITQANPIDKRPRWNTLSGFVGVFDENENAAINLNASSRTETDIRYTITKGNLPLGLTLNPSTGGISGKVDSIITKSSTTDTINLPRLIPIPVWTTTREAIPLAREKEDYSFVLSHEHLDLYGNVTKSIIAGSLPFGLILDANTGLISGAAAEIFNNTATTDGFALNEIQTKPIWDLVDTHYNVIEGESFNLNLVAKSQNLNFSTVAGTTTSSPQAVQYTVLKGSVPTGLSLNPSTGKLSGIVDSIFKKVTRDDKISLEVFSDVPQWTTTAIPTMKENSDYVVTLECDGATSMSIIDGSLPFGLMFDGQSGVLSGNASEIFMNDGSDDTSLIVVEPKPVWNGDVDMVAHVGQTTSIQLQAESLNVNFDRSVPETITYSINSGVLPVGLSLNPTSGIISGIPEKPYKVVSREDVIGVAHHDTHPVWTTPRGMVIKAGEEVDVEAQLTVDTANPVTFSVVDGALPFGLILDASTGVIGGRTVANQIHSEQEFMDFGSPVIETDGFEMSIGSAFSEKMEVSYVEGRTIKKVAIASGTLPTGLTYNPSTMVVSGTAKEAGEYHVKFMIEDSAGLMSVSMLEFAVTE